MPDKYPVVIGNPWTFPWLVGDRIERTNTETDSVMIDTIDRVITYKRYRAPAGPLAVNVKNQSVVFSPDQEDRYGPFSYRLLSRARPRPRPELADTVPVFRVVIDEKLYTEADIVTLIGSLTHRDKYMVIKLLERLK